MTPVAATLDRPLDVDLLTEDAAVDSGTPLTDDELTALALAADPDEALEPDAVPWRSESEFPELLPSWYMPVPGTTRSHKRWHTAVVVVLVAAFLIINILGCCITYGHLVAA